MSQSAFLEEISFSFHFQSLRKSPEHAKTANYLPIIQMILLQIFKEKFNRGQTMFCKTEPNPIIIRGTTKTAQKVYESFMPFRHSQWKLFTKNKRFNVKIPTN